MTLDYYDDYIFLQCIRAVCGNLATRYEIANFLKKILKFIRLMTSEI